ncbi:hypothetical protein G7Z17_g5413 [Cylindrodendrum hubeiense]|uniref:Uncharacterized protein n=1 Tax=Cylindrodendrum hubeiense TaxID=595255 RepID=A0A9P5HD02_9HYPO|nr:hypothetical protein G7Z17_g5413 [Cylindrodendrum hubeiense]
MALSNKSPPLDPLAPEWRRYCEPPNDAELLKSPPTPLLTVVCLVQPNGSVDDTDDTDETSRTPVLGLLLCPRSRRPEQHPTHAASWGPDDRPKPRDARCRTVHMVGLSTACDGQGNEQQTLESTLSAGTGGGSQAAGAVDWLGKSSSGTAAGQTRRTRGLPLDPRDAWPDYRCNSTPLEPIRSPLIGRWARTGGTPGPAAYDDVRMATRGNRREERDIKS